MYYRNMKRLLNQLINGYEENSVGFAKTVGDRERVKIELRGNNVNFYKTTRYRIL